MNARLAVPLAYAGIVSSYVDPVDGSTYPLGEPRWRSDAGRPLWIELGSGLGRNDIDTSAHSLWRYRAALPVEIASPITLGEGCTPLIEPSFAGGTPLFKADWMNPTGSFKDRGTSVMLSYLRDRGIRSILEDSSGNGGSSVAGYAAAGGLEATIFAPEATSAAKLAQVQAYGARLELVPGAREQSQNAAIAASGDTAFYASHNWQAFFLQGTKSLAYELWEDLGFRAPDNVIVPVGAGSSLLGCFIGFRELLGAGQITRMPRLYAAQPVNCSPVDASFTAGVDVPVERPVAPTIAEGTAIAHPLRLAQMIRALRETGGATIALAEAEISRALADLCSQGLFVEPTSATAAAAYSRLLSSGAIAPAETTVVLLTGAGLKAAEPVRDIVSAVRS
ncbi:threonine synthase [Paramicrobacterium agarici]|uniref:Threonine synthase n=1 Tax=Paramicrobacterium agarici TaxID=630514 RepID=A0A2A9DS24_9MICO|nr:threonine synthase [Microbacterium agarici]